MSAESGRRNAELKERSAIAEGEAADFVNAESGMRKAELKQRTFDFAVRVVRLVEALPKSGTAQVIGRQLLRAGTAVGANYRDASVRGRALSYREARHRIRGVR